MRIKYFLLSILLISFCSLNTFADGENQKNRYVATTGIDKGDCSQRNTPCATIKYAIDKAAKADAVLIAGGNYRVAAEDVVHFLGDKVPLKSGFSTRDLFNTQKSSLRPVTLIGIPAEFREELASKGFEIISDTKGLNQNRIKEIEKFTAEFLEVSNTSKPAIDCIDGLAGNFPCNNISLQSQTPLSTMSSSPSSASDIWGHVDLNNNREYALMGLRNGTVVFDVTDPENPSEVGTIPGSSSTWRDIKVYQFQNGASFEAYAYVTTEAIGNGLQIIDLNDLPNSVSLANTISEFSDAHNIYISNIDYSTNTALDGMDAFIYIAGADKAFGAFRIFDLNNPTNPSLITAPPAGTGYVHDASSMVITDARTSQCAAGHNPCEIYIDFNESTVDIWDTTDKTAPFRISVTPYANSAYTHSGWPSTDNNYIFIQDELDEQNRGLNTTLRTLDISSLTSPTVSATYTGPTRAIDHNGFTNGDKYYMSNYRRGLSVLNVSNPESITETAFFDTFPSPSANSANFDGAWGTYPYLPSGNILVSDINNGLFILEEKPTSFTNQSGVIGIVGSDLGVDENTNSITIDVERTSGAVGEVSVNYATSDGSATAGSDYESTSGTLTWVSNDSENKSFTVNITNDTTQEEQENFTITLSNPTNGANLATTAITVTINANDAPAPVIGGSPINNDNGGSGGGSFGLLFSFLLFMNLYKRKPLRRRPA